MDHFCIALFFIRNKLTDTVLYRVFLWPQSTGWLFCLLLVHAGSFCVSIIHWTLTQTTGSLTCAHDQYFACVYTQGLGTSSACQHNIFDLEKPTSFSSAPGGVRTSGLESNILRFTFTPRHPILISHINSVNRFNHSYSLSCHLFLFLLSFLSSFFPYFLNGISLGHALWIRNLLVFIWPWPVGFLHIGQSSKWCFPNTEWRMTINSIQYNTIQFNQLNCKKKFTSGVSKIKKVKETTVYIYKYTQWSMCTHHEY